MTYSYASRPPKQNNAGGSKLSPKPPIGTNFHPTPLSLHTHTLCCLGGGALIALLCALHREAVLAVVFFAHTVAVEVASSRVTQKRVCVQVASAKSRQVHVLFLAKSRQVASRAADTVCATTSSSSRAPTHARAAQQQRRRARPFSVRSMIDILLNAFGGPHLCFLGVGLGGFHPLPC